MASKYYGYWKCEYKSSLSSWREYYFVRTSAEWYYYDQHKAKWEAAWPNNLVPNRPLTFSHHKDINNTTIGGYRRVERVSQLEVVVVCGGLCKRRSRKCRK